MSEVLATGGSVTYVVLGLGGLGFLVVLVFAGLAFAKRRIPVTLFVLVPVLVSMVGALGTWSVAGSHLAGLANVPGPQVAETAMTGVWESLGADWLGRWVAAGILVTSCWAAAIGSAIATGPERLWTLGATAMSFICTIAGAVAVAVYAMQNSLHTEAYALAGLLLFGGLGVTLAATRRSIEDEHVFRVAGMRFAAGVSLVLGVAMGAMGMVLGSRVTFFGKGGIGSSHDMTLSLQDVIANWEALASPVATCAWIAFAMALVVAWFGFVAELGEVVQRYTLIDVLVTMLLFCVFGGVRALEGVNTSRLMDFGTHGPAPEIFEQFRSDLTAALLTYNRESFEVAPHSGGFDDVIAYVTFSENTETPDPTQPGGVKYETKKWQEWRRTHIRTATGWEKDGEQGTKVEEIPEIGGLPLFVVPGGAEAAQVVTLLRKVKGKKALFLLSAAEVRVDTVIPKQVAHKQVTFMPIEVDREMDLSKEVWFEAGSRNQVYVGPTLWFHEKQDEENAVYMRTLFEATGSPGAHVLVPERVRAKSLMQGCLTVMMGLQVAYPPGVEDEMRALEADKIRVPKEGEIIDYAAIDVKLAEAKKKGVASIAPSERWCSLTTIPRLEMREKAAAAYATPAVQRTKFTYKHKVENMDKEAESVFQSEIEKLVARELPAFEWCQDQARQVPGLEPKDLVGELWLEIPVRRIGSVSDVVMAEKSKMQSPLITRCVARRLKSLEFAEMPDPPPIVDAEGKETEVPGANRSFELFLTYQ